MAVLRGQNCMFVPAMCMRARMYAYLYVCVYVCIDV